MEFNHDDPLDMRGDWKLTYGHDVALVSDGTTVGHWVPTGSLHTHPVRFESRVKIARGYQYKGRYLPGGDAHNPGSENLGSLIAETFYAKRGVVVVQLTDSVEQYIAVLSGYHHRYIAEPANFEIVGGWADVGSAPPTQNSNSGRGNFRMVKV